MNRVEVTREAIIALLSKEVKLQELKQLIDNIADELVRKNTDYGDAWQRFGLFTPLIRLNDKLLRLKQGADGKPYLVADEGIEDTVKDILGYSILLMLWLDNNHNISIVRNPWGDCVGMGNPGFAGDDDDEDCFDR